MNKKETTEVTIAGHSAGDEDVFTVTRPAGDLAPRRMPGDASGDPADRRNDVYVVIAPQMRSKRDLGTVRGVVWSSNHVAVRSQALRFTSLAWHGPDIVGIAEGNAILRQRRATQQQVLVFRRRDLGTNGGNRDKNHEQDEP